ncbi:MAG TPA: hypothetical protein VFE88_04460 [Candidatus Nanoarchaeia archaeon]|nr:hypothetical protein [Candidatus Nanoarchaeia archaeon]
MSLNLLKYNAEVLAEVVRKYENLLGKRDQNDPKIDAEIKLLKSHVLFLLTGLKKEVEREKNAG